MLTIWGVLDRIGDDPEGRRWVQIKALMSEGTTIRVRALVDKQTLIARGVERIPVSSLCVGEIIEVSYRHGRDGFVEADTIYVRPERVPVA